MDSFSIHLSSGLWIVCIAALLAAVGISIWTYQRTIPRTTPGRRRVLIALRSLGLALILFVLFQPVLTLTKTQVRLPKISVLLDNSRSMLLSDTPGDTTQTRLKVMQQTLGSIVTEPQEQQKSLYSVAVFSESTSVVDTPLTRFASTLKGDGSVTDLSTALAAETELQKKENIGAVILLSDGAYTAGSNPAYAAEKLGVPIYTIGIGDSTERRDIAVSNFFTNDIATINVAQPVDVTIHTVGAREGEKAVVSLYAENEKLDEEQVTLHTGTSDEPVTFTFTPKIVGMTKLSARISSIGSDEASSRNNLKIRYVNVLKNTFKIVLFAGAPSSDVSFIKDYFSLRKEIELSTFIQKQGAEFYEGAPTYEKVQGADLVILIGFPIASSSDESIALVKRLVASDGHSMLFIPSRSLDLAKLKKLDEALPFSITSVQASTNELSVSTSINPAEITNPILRADKSQTAAVKWEALAPLVKTETHFVAKPESDVLAEATLQGVKIGEPIIISRTIGKSRQIAFTAYGLWKWKLTSFGRERAFAAQSRTKEAEVISESALDVFLSNAARWLVMRDDKKRIRIEPTQRLYDAGEAIEFTGQVYDESFVPIDQAIVTATINGAALSSAVNITLEPLSNGRYSTKLPQGLSAGEYRYNATATLDGKTLGTDGGRFNVGEYSVEFAEPRMRSEVLREIALRSGGKFYTSSDVSNLLNDIKASVGFAPKQIDERSEYEARMSWYILGLAIAFFSTEWFLRKRSGML